MCVLAQSKTAKADGSSRMLTEPIPKIILIMAFPTIIAFLINSIYSLADTFFVSSLGTNATAAVSVNSSLDQFIMMGGSMLAVGANSYIARLLGAGKKDKANETLSTAFFLALAFGSLIAVCGMTFMKPMVRLMGATSTCESYAIEYATYVLMVAPLMAANFVMNQCLRAEGSAMRSMLGMALGGVLNCFLDPIFIFGLGMGVAGASMATAISKVVSFAILFYPYLRHKSVLRISYKMFRLEKKMLTEIVNVGSSSMLRSALSVVSAIVLNNIAGSISDSVLAGIGVSTKIMMFPFGIILGFGSGFQPVTGFNWGAKRYDRVKDSFRFASLFSIAGSLLMTLFLCMFTDPLITLFAKADLQTHAIGALCIRSQSLVLAIHGWVAVVNMFCAGLGDARGARLLSTARQGSCFLPIVYPMAWLWGGNGLACVQAAADVISLVLAFPVLARILRKVSNAEKQAQQISDTQPLAAEV